MQMRELFEAPREAGNHVRRCQLAPLPFSPEPLMFAFAFATGIENSAPTIKSGKVRMDQLEKRGFYQRCSATLRSMRCSSGAFNAQRFLSLDLNYGHEVDSRVYRFLMETA